MAPGVGHVVVYQVEAEGGRERVRASCACGWVTEWAMVVREGRGTVMVLPSGAWLSVAVQMHRQGV